MLVDTDILIDYFRGIPESIDFVERELDQISVSVISVAELYQGVRDGRERTALESFLSAVTVLSTDFEIGKRAGLYRREYKGSHNTGLADCLIAATAAEQKIPLRTLNTKHFPMLRDVLAPYEKG